MCLFVVEMVTLSRFEWHGKSVSKSKLIEAGGLPDRLEYLVGFSLGDISLASA